MQHIKRVGELHRRAGELSLLSQSVTTPAIRSRLSREAAELLYTADQLARAQPPERTELPTRPAPVALVDAPLARTELPRRPEPVALVDALCRMERTERAVINLFRRLGVSQAITIS
jgi:hypothetical protein